MRAVSKSLSIFPLNLRWFVDIESGWTIHGHTSRVHSPLGKPLFWYLWTAPRIFPLGEWTVGLSHRPCYYVWVFHEPHMKNPIKRILWQRPDICENPLEISIIWADAVYYSHFLVITLKLFSYHYLNFFQICFIILWWTQDHTQNLFNPECESRRLLFPPSSSKKLHHLWCFLSDLSGQRQIPWGQQYI